MPVWGRPAFGAGLNRFVKDTKMNTRRLFSKMAQIVIWILLVVLAFFLIRGFAQGDTHEKKRVYRSNINDSSLVMKKWKESSVSFLHSENTNNDNHDLTGRYQNKV